MNIEKENLIEKQNILIGVSIILIGSIISLFGKKLYSLLIRLVIFSILIIAHSIWPKYLQDRTVFSCNFGI